MVISWIAQFRDRDKTQVTVTLFGNGTKSKATGSIGLPKQCIGWKKLPPDNLFPWVLGKLRWESGAGLGLGQKEGDSLDRSSFGMGLPWGFKVRRRQEKCFFPTPFSFKWWPRAHSTFSPRIMVWVSWKIVLLTSSLGPQQVIPNYS